MGVDVGCINVCSNILLVVCVRYAMSQVNGGFHECRMDDLITVLIDVAIIPYCGQPDSNAKRLYGVDTYHLYHTNTLHHFIN